jgi:hypothetical protein
MNPLFVVTAVRAVIRIGRTAQDAFEQYAQEKPLLLPDAEDLPDDPVGEIITIAQDFPAFQKLLEDDEELKKLWSDNLPTDKKDATEIVYSAALRFEQRALLDTDPEAGDAGLQAEYVAAQTGDELVGGILAAQWAKGKGPVTPATRVVLALADVALEYVGQDPRVLGVGGNGEKLIGAIAASIAEAIPDASTRETLGPRDRFAERLAALVLRTGLKTLSDHPNLIFGADHLQALLKNTIPPVLDAMPSGPGSLAEQIMWRRVTDAFFGPAVAAAMETVAKNPSAYFGQDFASERAAGVLVSGLLKAAALQDLQTRLSEDGLFALFRAAAGIAAQNSALILGDLTGEDLKDPAKRNAAEEIAVNLFQSVSGVLANKAAPFGENLGVSIAVSILDGLKNAGPRLFPPDDPWKNVAGGVLSQILDGFSEGLLDQNKRLRQTVFSEAKLLDLARVFVDQIAKTPHLVAGDNAEIQRLVMNVALAISADEHLLLTQDDWIRIAGVAAHEASLNPGRLFGISDKNPKGLLANELISRLLRTASEDFLTVEGRVGPVLVGETLRDSIITALRAVGGNIGGALTNLDKIDALAKNLNQVFAKRQFDMGGKEWLRLFNELLPGVLRTGELPVLSDKKINQILAQRG